ncbi:MAG: KEOPS complex subunit Pcc1 [Fervidicoccaceae archaeon]
MRPLRILKYKLDLKIYSDDDKLIESLLLSLKPEESSQTDEKRGKINVSRGFSESFLSLSIESEDEGGFKALVNSYLYLIKASTDSLSAAIDLQN